MKDIEIISIEPTSMGKYWVVAYKTSHGLQETEMIEAIDYNEAFIKFRNQMINQSKNKN
jgi:hypothetical protein